MLRVEGIDSLINLAELGGEIHYLLLILFMLMLRWSVHLKRGSEKIRFCKCFVLRPAIRLRHIWKLDNLLLARINSITSFSCSPNWNLIASNGVRSSQAIWMIRSISSSENLFTTSTFFTTIYDLIPIFLPFLTPGERTVANWAVFGW